MVDGGTSGFSQRGAAVMIASDSMARVGTQSRHHLPWYSGSHFESY